MKPDIIVFLDGFNEFLPLQYSGGKPDEDVIWAVDVKGRMDNIWHYILLNKVAYRSNLLTLIFLKTALINAPFRSKTPQEEEIKEAAQIYINNIKKIDDICSINNIRCLFFLQPTLFHKSNKADAEKAILKQWSNFHPNISRSLDIGYSYILNNSNIQIINLSESIDTPDHVYIDLCHMNKIGNRILATIIAKELNKYWSE